MKLLPECGDMKAPCVCGPAGLTEPDLEPRGLKPVGLWAAILEELGRPLSQPDDTRNWASGVSSDGALNVRFKESKVKCSVVKSWACIIHVLIVNITGTMHNKYTAQEICQWKHIFICFP